MQRGLITLLGLLALWERRTLLEAFLKVWTVYLASGVEGIASAIIALAVLQTTIQAILLFIGRRQRVGQHRGAQIELVRLSLGRWLTLALEFELGADILRTAIAPTWNEIGQLAAIAAIRTLLNYFLQQEINRAVKNHPDLEPSSLATDRWESGKP